MVHYAQSKIYQIVCKDPNVEEFYIGSTKDFQRRRRQHKHSCTNVNSKKHKTPVYKFIRENGGWDAWTMAEICEVQYRSEKYLRKVETQFVQEWGATLNSVLPFRTTKQTKEYHSKYVRANRDKIDAYAKQYLNKHKEVISIKRKKYRRKNNVRIKAWQSEKHVCTCGSHVTRANLAQHRRSKKHQNYIANSV